MTNKSIQILLYEFFLILFEKWWWNSVSVLIFCSQDTKLDVTECILDEIDTVIFFSFFHGGVLFCYQHPCTQIQMVDYAEVLLLFESIRMFYFVMLSYDCFCVFELFGDFFVSSNSAVQSVKLIFSNFCAAIIRFSFATH